VSGRVFIADSHTGFRRDLGLYLSMLDGGYQVVGEAGTAADTLRLIARLAPDIVLVDVELPDSNGLHTIRTIRERWPATVVIVISNNPAAEYRQAALDAHAADYIDKIDVVEVLPVVLAAVARRSATPAPRFYAAEEFTEGPVLRSRFRADGGGVAVLSQPAPAEFIAALLRALVVPVLAALAAGRVTLLRRVAALRAHTPRHHALTGWQYVHLILALAFVQVILAMQSILQSGEPGHESTLAIIFVATLGIAVLEVRQLSRALRAARGGRDGS
jgi:DNA-binding response OmpR family regulator